MMSEMWWGLRPEEGVKVAWGARAIDEGRSFGLLSDRQSIHGGDVKDRMALAEKLDGGVLRACQKRFAELKNEYKLQGSSSDEYVLYESDDVIVRASPLGSHGYIYLVAEWRMV